MDAIPPVYRQPALCPLYSLQDPVSIGHASARYFRCLGLQQCLCAFCAPRHKTCRHTPLGLFNVSYSRCRVGAIGRVTPRELTTYKRNSLINADHGVPLSSGATL